MSQDDCLRCDHAKDVHESGDDSVGISPTCWWRPAPAEGQDETLDDDIFCQCPDYYGPEQAAVDEYAQNSVREALADPEIKRAMDFLGKDD